MRLWSAELLALSSYVSAVWSQESAIDGLQNSRSIQREQLLRMQDFLGPPPPRSPPVNPAKGSTITFKNPAAEKFLVDGTKIPDGGQSFSD